MEQFVIRTGSKEPSEQYLSKSFLGTYFYTEKAHIYDEMKNVKPALSWGKKYKAEKIKKLKKEIKGLQKEVDKGNLSINKVLLVKAKENLASVQSYKFKVIKL